MRALPPRRVGRSRNARGAPVLLACAVLLIACSGRHGPAGTRPPDLVLISLDTFRADLLELARADGTPELPALERLARESIRFDNAWAPQPFTLPSHMTMLTGLHPLAHGIDQKGKRLAAGVPTVAELLRGGGYRTVGVGCGPWLERQYGFSRGFDSYKNVGLRLTFADRVRARSGEALARLPADDRPRFLFAHFYDAHGDWGKSDNRLTYYSPPEYRADLETPESATCAPGAGCAIPFLMRIDERREPIDRAFAAAQFELYRRGARALDAELAVFFDELRRARLWDEALVVVTADHGEEFGEHGRYIHAQIFRETLRVPLLVKLPGGARGGTRESRPVALEDIAPTLLARAGVSPPRGLLGFDLLAPPRSGSARPLVARQNARLERFALRLGGRLLVRDLAAGERRLFDLAADPLEHVELAPGLPATRSELEALEQRLEGTLRAIRAGRREPEERKEKSDDAEAADLRALGYLD